MRPIAGPAALVTIVAVYLLHRAFGPHEPEPPSSFLDAELALDGEATRGSCYALETVLLSNFALRTDIVRSWSNPAPDTWQLRVEGIAGAPNEPQHFASNYRFVARGGRITLARVESEDAQPRQSPESALADLLRAPKARDSARLAQCVPAPLAADAAAPTP